MEPMIGFDVECRQHLMWLYQSNMRKNNARNIEFMFNVSMWHELTNKLVPNLLDLTPIWQL